MLKVTGLCQVSQAPGPPHSTALQQLQVAILHFLPVVRLAVEKLPKIKRQMHRERLRSGQGHCLFPFCHLLCEGLGRVALPFRARFLVRPTAVRAPVLPLRKRAMWTKDVAEK